MCAVVFSLAYVRVPLIFYSSPLCEQDGKVRLCDFGSCKESPIYVRNMEERQAAEEHIAKETTQMYRAPEMVDLYLRPTLTEKTDIWALGCMLYAMCFMIHPFQDGSSLGILNAKITFPENSPYAEDIIHALILRLLDVSLPNSK
jgi:serine/threonine protein kinase